MNNSNLSGAFMAAGLVTRRFGDVHLMLYLWTAHRHLSIIVEIFILGEDKMEGVANADLSY